jgi:hypothetical protein
VKRIARGDLPENKATVCVGCGLKGWAHIALVDGEAVACADSAWTFVSDDELRDAAKKSLDRAERDVAVLKEWLARTGGEA